MKTLFNIRRLWLSIVLTLFLPYIPQTHELVNDNLRLGVPYRFYTIHMNTFNGADVHVSVSVFLLDLILMYLAITLVAKVLNMANDLHGKK